MLPFWFPARSGQSSLMANFQLFCNFQCQCVQFVFLCPTYRCLSQSVNLLMWTIRLIKPCQANHTGTGVTLRGVDQQVHCAADKSCHARVGRASGLPAFQLSTADSAAIDFIQCKIGRPVISSTSFKLWCHVNLFALSTGTLRGMHMHTSHFSRFFLCNHQDVDTCPFSAFLHFRVHC